MNPVEQLRILAEYTTRFEDMPRIGQGLSALSFKTLQINLGKKCNQACTHCHVDASPNRTEMMTRETLLDVVRLLENAPTVDTVDITGGAPELHPEFRTLVERCLALGRRVMDRCNLTILEEPGNDSLYEFLSSNSVEIIASLPHFSAERTDRQRGRGVFDTSVTALRRLNELGYGTHIPLNLVYNPSGFFLSGSQSQLEREFRENLGRRFGIVFNSLYCINNLPISRFLATLIVRGKFTEYMDTLVAAYNPGVIEGLMCRHQLSVGWDGRLYDCDFNQMLEIESEVPRIEAFDYDLFMNRIIRTNTHCFGCTAGAGSSCGGEIAGAVLPEPAMR